MLDQWEVKFLNHTVKAEYKAFPEDSRAKISKIINVIRQEGFAELHEPYIKHIQGKLWEIIGKSGRALYVAVTGKQMIILRCFVKKTNQTPLREITIALKRLKEVETNDHDSI